MTVALAVEDTSHVAAARRTAERAARAAGMDDPRAAEVGLAVTELATNILKHARRGEVLITNCRSRDEIGVEVIALDWGQGFVDIEAAMVDGHSTAGSLGHGLGAVRRLATEFEVFSQRTIGAVVLARIWPGPAPARRPEFALGGISVAKAGESACGDAWASDSGPARTALIVADGLGHGPLAADAAAAAIEEFARAPMREPGPMIEDLHLALRHTRGAAIGVTAIDLEREIAVFAGVGNIGGAIVSKGVRRNILSHNGTAGHAVRKVEQIGYPLPAGAAVVIHSDGLATHWDPSAYGDIWTHDPSIVAAMLYRDHSRRRDDVTVVVGIRRG